MGIKVSAMVMDDSKTVTAGEADQEARGLSRKLLHSQRGITVHRISGSISDLLSREVSVDASENVLLMSLSGSAVWVSDRMGIRDVQAPKGAIFARGPLKFDVHFSRGIHRWLEISWRDDAIRTLAEWQAGELGTKSGTWNCQFDDHSEFLNESLANLWDALTGGTRNQEPLLLVIISILVEMSVTGQIKDTLAAIPDSVPEPLNSLMREVKKRPTDSWSLREAANMAGYSAFHLSRTFRIALDFGFPEFVDRCRTELAVKALLSSDESIEEIANKCGFGSTQALRSACREYLGFLPSEIRSVQIGLH